MKNLILITYFQRNIYKYKIKHVNQPGDIGFRKNVKVIIHIYSKEKITKELYKEITSGIVLFKK